MVSSTQYTKHFVFPVVEFGWVRNDCKKLYFRIIDGKLTSEMHDRSSVTLIVISRTSNSRIRYGDNMIDCVILKSPQYSVA